MIDRNLKFLGPTLLKGMKAMQEFGEVADALGGVVNSPVSTGNLKRSKIMGETTVTIDEVVSRPVEDTVTEVIEFQVGLNMGDGIVDISFKKRDDEENVICIPVPISREMEGALPKDIVEQVRFVWGELKKYPEKTYIQYRSAKREQVQLPSSMEEALTPMKTEIAIEVINFYRGPNIIKTNLKREDYFNNRGVANTPEEVVKRQIDPASMSLAQMQKYLLSLPNPVLQDTPWKGDTKEYDLFLKEEMEGKSLEETTAYMMWKLKNQSNQSLEEDENNKENVKKRIAELQTKLKGAPVRDRLAMLYTINDMKRSIGEPVDQKGYEKLYQKKLDVKKAKEDVKKFRDVNKKMIVEVIRNQGKSATMGSMGSMVSGIQPFTQGTMGYNMKDMMIPNSNGSVDYEEGKIDFDPDNSLSTTPKEKITPNMKPLKPAVRRKRKIIL